MNFYYLKKKKKMVTWQLYYSAVKQFPPIFQSSGQSAMQFSDFSSYLSTPAWEQCKLHSSGVGQKPVSDQFPLQKLWSSRDKKWTISHNHRKILCYTEVTRTNNHIGFREPRCLRSSAAPQNQFSSCVIWSSVVTIPHSSCREANFFCKCR